MGWFDEQIRERIQNDENLMADARAQMENLFRGRNKLEALFSTERRTVSAAIGEILDFYHVRAREMPENLNGLDEILEFLLRPSGIMRREVRLTGKWYQDATGAMLGTTVDGMAVALVPDRKWGYLYKNPKTGKSVRVTKKNAGRIEEHAICFYKPFPLRSLGIRDLLQYCFGMLQARDYVLVGLMALLVAVVGTIIPLSMKIIYGKALAYGSIPFLAAAVTMMLCASLAQTLMYKIRNLINFDVQNRTNLSVQSAAMMRILSLPPAFFKKYSSGELYSRYDGLNRLCSILFEGIFSVGLTAVCSLVYIGQIFSFAPALVVPALAITLLTVAVMILASLAQINNQRLLLKAGSREQGILYELFNGIPKIKNAGAERRAFAKWAERYRKVAEHTYAPPAIVKMNSTINLAISLLGTYIMYCKALSSGVNVADYVAFDSAYGMVSGAFMTLAGSVLSFAQIRPVLEMAEPILKTPPEISEEKQVVSELHGKIELNNISFRYAEDMPYILDNFSLKINPGQYVAIVGKTGCGKSTLMRMLLGFETPSRGAIYYDGRDISSMDVKSLRRRIGVVMQDAKLFQGDIYSNITISAPQLSVEEAWEAARMAGMAEDIEHMPMGMYTQISEGQGGISGGQRQRLAIARAIAPKPQILMFDEATSALDNVTQKVVSESLDKLNCTRIVIAHRLSTIRHCDRILVMDKGKIIEDGTYEELVERGGFFAELVERQRVEAAG